MKENELSKEERLRFIVAQLFDGDIEKAGKVCDFILNKGTPNAYQKQSMYTDGVYYALSDHTLVKANVNNAQSYISEIVGVAVIKSDRIATAALHDVANGKDVALTIRKFDSTNFYKNLLCEAISDYNGQDNTKDFITCLNPEIELNKDDYIPSLAQLHLILSNLKLVNEALVAVDGTPFNNHWYWTSTKKSSYHAWMINLGSGYSGPEYILRKAKVRPSVDVNLKN